MKCEWCEENKNLTKHHIIPRRIRKSLSRNGVFLCRKCHDKADNETITIKINENLYKIDSPFGEFLYHTITKKIFIKSKVSIFNTVSGDIKNVSQHQIKKVKTKTKKKTKTKAKAKKKDKAYEYYLNLDNITDPNILKAKALLKL